MSTSKLYDFDPIEADDDLELELTRLYAKHREVAKNKSEIELHNFLQDKASINKKEYHDVVSALLYGVLTEPERASTFFQSISFVNRDQFATVINKLQSMVISIKFQSLKLAVREQIFWIISELTSLGVGNIDVLYLCLLRQIRGGDTSQPNLILCDGIVKLCERHKAWLYTNIRIIPTVAYTYLRAIADHKSIQLQALQQREIKFIMTLFREKWDACSIIGRDLVRVLHDLSLTIPEFTKLWEDLLQSPKSLSSRFNGVEELLKMPTKKEFLRCRLTPDIEFKLLFILQNLRSNQYQRNLNWFIQRFLSTPESEPFYVDIVRYLVAGWYPSNQILQSDIVPRYVIIGSMLRSIKSKAVVANVKMALIYDWLFFTPTDNIMFIEPAMLLMERSAERYPNITSVIMEYLKQSVTDYFPPLRDYIARCVACGMKVLLTKGVIRSLTSIYKCPSTDSSTRENMVALFSEFLADDPSAQAIPIPAMPANLQPSMPNTPKTEVGYTTEEEQEETYNQPHVDDDDVDEYLYGDSDTNSKTPKPIEEEDEEMGEVVATEPSILPSETDAKDESKLATIGIVATIIAEEKMDTDDDDDNDDKDEVNPTENIHSNQSYWIFGDSLKRFKEASTTAISAQKDENNEQYATHLQIAKKSLKEILAVFLRMAIPAETLLPTIGSFVRNMIVCNLITHETSAATSQSEVEVIDDPSKDLFDLIMFTFWNSRDKQAARDKLIRLIGGIAHSNKSKGRRHIVGMRWWSFIAAQLKADESIESPCFEEWLPGVLTNYETYVMHAYAIEEASIDQTEYTKDYLGHDLKMVAEQSIDSFNQIIPHLYQYFSRFTADDPRTLKITISMLLPDTMSKMICGLHYGSICIFRESIDMDFVGQSLSLPTYETMCFWQLLAAQLQGDYDGILNFFSQLVTKELLKTDFKGEITSSLFSMVTSVSPTKDLLYAIISILPENHRVTQLQVQFILASFQYWAISTGKVFLTAVSQLTNKLTVKMESEEESQSVLATKLVSVLTMWYNQALCSESFKKDKALLSSLSKLAIDLNKPYPEEWLQDSRRKKRSILLDSDEE